MQRNWNRRKFVATSLSVTGVIVAGGLIETKESRFTRGCICLLPVEGVNYSESFARFMERARFDSVRDALASIRDRSVPVRVAHQSATVHSGQLTSPPWAKVCETRRPGIYRAAGHYPVTVEHSRPAKS